MLRKIRLTLAIVCFTLITLLFLDFTGTVHTWFGWMAKVQFLPAVLALNVGVVAALLLLTGVLGRVYCSVICPLGVMQDLISWVNSRRKKKRNRFSYSPEKPWLRYGILTVFIACIVAGIGSAVALLAPYSAYGRIVSSLLSPLYKWGNNGLAYLAERADSYAFYTTEVWIKSLPVLIIAVVTLVILAILAWRNGRTYCNTVCPVGTLLSFVSRYSLLRPVIDTEKCNNCGLCARRCKAACIDSKTHAIDYSRCIVCMDCIENCRQGAISYRLRRKSAPDAAPPKAASAPQSQGSGVDTSRRTFLTTAGLTAATAVLRAEEKKVDGGLAVIADKQIPERHTPIVPPGAKGLWHMTRHCTGCQLCISVCPNNVLRPSTGLTTLMQPEMSYERGYCRPECNKCAEVCPAGAIHFVTPAEKSSIQIGHAVWVRKNCLPLTEGVSCGNCARHCPVGAITMVPAERDNPDSPKVPFVDTERCIGCGACENLCPARPFSAIYVEGHEQHREV